LTPNGLVTRARDMSPAKRALGAATLSIVIGAIPVFLLGALAVFIRDDLEFSELRLGLLASAYYAASAVASIPGGRLAERVGGRRAAGIGAAISGSAMFGVAVAARSWGSLLACMVMAGIGNGIALPASNLLLARGVPHRQQGVAFGIKQSAGPIATLFAGASVPAIGLTIGWRWAFVIVGLASLPLVIAGRSGRTKRRRRPEAVGSVRVGPLIVLALGAAGAVIGGSSLAAFYVESSVAAGLSAGVSGALLATGSVLGISSRIGWGWVAGRWHGSQFPLVGALLVVGSLGFLVLGKVSTAPGIGLVTVVVFATGWGWPAVFNLAIVLRSPLAPAFATGIAATGLYSGGIVGPVVFGAIVETSGYSAAWNVVAACVFVGGVLIYLGGRSLERAQSL